MAEQNNMGYPRGTSIFMVYSRAPKVLVYNNTRILQPDQTLRKPARKEYCLKSPRLSVVPTDGGFCLAIDAPFCASMLLRQCDHQAGDLQRILIDKHFDIYPRLLCRFLRNK